LLNGANGPVHMDEKVTAESIVAYFDRVPDPRVARSRKHPLTSVLVLSLLAVISGADGFVDIELFGQCQQEILEQFLDLPNGIPSHDTIGRIFAALNPLALQEAFREWIANLAQVTKGEVVAIDGKTLRRSFRHAEDKAFVHMVSAWATHNRVVLGQVKTEEKSNEITAIPRLLELLQIKGATVTIDAMGCQKEIAKKIVEREANYMLAVKENQPTLHSDIVALFNRAAKDPDFLDSFDFCETTNKGHGRIEARRCWTCSELDSISQRMEWSNLACVALVEVDRTVNGKTSTEQRYYIASKKPLRAKEALATVRSHWGIENELHWVLDIAFREDECRVRAGYAAENFAVMRHITLNLLKNAKCKGGMKNRRLRAAWDRQFLWQLLFG
jgi:predicted transposase YbfD/YdcC